MSRLLHRRKKPGPFVPANHLERLLVKAADDPAVRPEFLRALLDSKICVIGWTGDVPPTEEVSFVARGGEKLNVRTVPFEGRTVTPVFTSPERVAAYAPGVTYVAMTTRDLLAIIGAQELVMNPGSAYGKHFLRQEVQNLLDGSAFRPRQSWVAEKEEQMLIGRPAKYPDQFVEALRRMFARRTDVRRAYVALIHFPSRSEAPNLYLAIDTDGDLKSIAADCGVVAAATLEEGEFTDIGSTALAPEYFAKDTPIFVRE